MKKLIIVLVVIALIAAGYYIYSIKATIEPSAINNGFNSPACAPGYTYSPQQGTCNLLPKYGTNTDWKTAGNESVSFQYPSTWAVKEVTEQRPGSVYNAGFWILPPGALMPGGTDTGNDIVIVTNGYGDTCGQSTNLSRCKTIKSRVTVFTRSTDKTVLAIYDQLVQTVK